MTTIETIPAIQAPLPDASGVEFSAVAGFTKPLSGKHIATEILGGVEPTKDLEVESALSEEAKQTQLEKLRAERFGILGATIAKYYKEIVSVGSEQARPELLLGDVKPYIFTHPLRLDDGPEGPGIYKCSTNQTEVSAFFDGFDKALTENVRDWFSKAQESDPDVAKWAGRFDVVIDEAKALNLPEFIIQHNFGAPSKPEPVYPGSGVEEIDKLKKDYLAAFLIETAGNVPAVYGSMAMTALSVMDREGISDTAQRLTILDDIVLQTLDRSRLHLEKFFRQREPGSEEGVTLVQRNNGRWELDWADKVVANSDNQLTRTQNCPAAYETIEGHSPIKLIGFALNSELNRRGLLEPGAANARVEFTPVLSEYIDFDDANPFAGLYDPSL